VLLAAVPGLRHLALGGGEAWDAVRGDVGTCTERGLRAGLGYAYSGRVWTGETAGEAMEVLHAAGALGLDGLVRAAARRLEAELAPGTVADVWRAAHAQGVKRLKAR
jgi:hypothetical protein